MFSLATGVYESYFASPQLNVLVIGCESAGKTALLERVKVTEFSTKAPPKNSGSKLLSCPAPKRYSQAALDDNDMHVNADSSEEVFEPSARFVTPQISSQENMEDVIFESPVQALDEVNTRNEEFNVKPGHSMLPMVKIRPTSGTNLAKVSICGCRCSFFDVSGKFQDLWVKYYGDADAVIFCWQLGKNREQQQKVLEAVRRQIDDNIPVLIFGHNMDSIPDEALPTNTSVFISHYTSNMMQLYCGSAKSGQGIKEAMEWLIPLARRQIKLKATLRK